MSDNLARIIGAPVHIAAPASNATDTAEEHRKVSVAGPSPTAGGPLPLDVYSTQVVPFTSVTPRPGVAKKLEFV